MAAESGYAVCQRSTCRICDGANLTPYLDLGDQPPSNSFITIAAVASERSFPLQVFLCTDCGLSQLIHVVSASDIFDEYAYLSSTSKALCNHYQGLVDAVLNRFDVSNEALVVDVGCNDGIMLNRYPAGRFRLLGIEPSSAGEYARQAGHEVIAAFFDEELGASISAARGGASIITATNVFAHVDNIHGFARGIRQLLAPDGVFVIEFPYLDDMLSEGYFDTVYHEHLCYFALTPLMHLFAETGLRPIDVERIDVGASGPALRLFVCRKEAKFEAGAAIKAMLDAEQAWGVKSLERYKAFAKTADEVKNQIIALVRSLNASGQKVGGFGAPAKGNTLLNFLGLTATDIVAIAENNELKIGKVTPGSHIPIVSDDEFMRLGISHAILLSWNYAAFFLKNSKFIRDGGKFIVPLPELCVRP